MALSNKRQAFVEEYLRTWNATEAARRANYAQPHVQGSRLLENVGIRAEISARLAEKAVSADEVIVRIGEHARGTMADFLDIAEDGSARIDLRKAELAGKLHLIKSFSDSPRTGVKIDLYDAQAALGLLAKAHGAFIERLQVDVRRDVSELTDEELANIIRSRSGAGEAPDGA